jgi:orotidine-5'-phosphate decarboxylase
MEPFGTRLLATTASRGQLCVGIDPHAALLRAWGLDDDVSGLERFALSSVEALAGEVAVLKPQSAFFERHGSAGIAVLERAVRSARELGALVLLDAKRGDVGSTMQGYADAYLDQTSPLAVDAMTVSPFLGFESLRPVLDVASAHGAGVFVLALTSNPEGPEVQCASTGTGTVAGSILGSVARENAGAAPLGSVGAVVAANLVAVGENLAVNGPILAPGYGAQGGSAENLARNFAGLGRCILPSTSREILSAGPDPAALRRAARTTAAQVDAALRAADE